MGFRIYYGDGSTHDGLAGDAPRLNVQAIALTDESASNYNVGRLVLQGWDFYLYGKARWYGVNGTHDLVDHLLFERVEHVLKGRIIPNAEYQAILTRANEELGLPAKSGKNPRTEDGRS